jgi:hypothetical protein
MSAFARGERLAVRRARFECSERGDSTRLTRDEARGGSVIVRRGRDEARRDRCWMRGGRPFESREGLSASRSWPYGRMGPRERSRARLFRSCRRGMETHSRRLSSQGSDLVTRRPVFRARRSFALTRRRLSASRAALFRSWRGFSRGCEGCQERRSGVGLRRRGLAQRGHDRGGLVRVLLCRVLQEHVTCWAASGSVRSTPPPATRHRHRQVDSHQRAAQLSRNGQQLRRPLPSRCRVR